MLRFFRSSRYRSTGKARKPVAESRINGDTLIRGTLDSKGRLRIDGAIYGIVTARELTVDLDGFVMGELIAETIIVHGRVTGPLQCKHVHLMAGARVEGDIHTITISMEKGAQFRGAVLQDREFQRAEPKRRPAAEESEQPPMADLKATKEDRFAGVFAAKVRARS